MADEGWNLTNPRCQWASNINFRLPNGFTIKYLIVVCLLGMVQGVKLKARSETSTIWLNKLQIVICVNDHFLKGNYTNSCANGTLATLRQVWFIYFVSTINSCSKSNIIYYDHMSLCVYSRQCLNGNDSPSRSSSLENPITLKVGKNFVKMLTWCVATAAVFIRTKKRLRCLVWSNLWLMSMLYGVVHR